MKHVLLALAACTGSLVASAQHFQCGTDRMRAERIAADPTYLEREAALEAEIQDLLRNSARVERDREVVVTIPIVFHVLHLNGSDNITNEQILNQVELLNEDYRALNADISTVHPAFEDLVGDAMIQFALPTLDPQGNCTNGIDRVRTPETLRGDDRSKMNPWPRDKYLNVWIAEQMRDGVAGYAYYPGTFEGPVQRLADGIIILNDYIGEIGTSNPFRSTALTHEVGHYLNLPHVWGNNNGVENGEAPFGHMVPECGEDGVEDTPITKGWDICPQYNDANFASIGWGDCDSISFERFPYDFDGVTTGSGTADPTTLLNPTDTSLGQTRVRAQMLPFTAVGVGGNSTQNGKFSFTGWGDGPVNGENNYAFVSPVLDEAKYYSFTLDPNISDLLYLDSIGFKISRNTTGIRTFAVRSSVSNFQTNLPIRAAGNPNIRLQANNVAFITSDVPLNDLTVYVDPPAQGYHYNQQPITFRIYAWNAENANGQLRVCADSDPVDLFERLGGAPQPGGTWSGPSATDGTFDPATMEAGTYTYTLDLGGACPTFTAAVDVSITPAPAPPVISGNPNICVGGTTTLTSSINNNIVWGTGQTSVSITVNTPGTYTVTYTQNECSAISEPFEVISFTRESAGTNGTLELCASSPAVPMFPNLGGTPATGGIWTGPSEVIDGAYDPTIMEPGTYTYTIPVNGPCAQSTAQVVVTEIDTVNAGTNGNLSVCNNATAILFDRLGGGAQFGGIWNGPNGPVIDGIYDATTMAPGVYDYIVDLGGDCGIDSATVTVAEINAPPVPTITGNTTFCEGSGVQLVSSASQGNAWLPGGPNTPAFNVTKAGTYTLRVTNNGNGCSSVSAPITITAQQRVNAGGDAELTICDQSSDIDLFAVLKGNPGTGGVWNGPSEVVNGLYQPQTMESGTYTYTVTGTSPCPNDEASIIVSESSEPALNPGTFGVDDVVVYGSTNIIENIQNYMEYSYCSVMFTTGQVNRMRAAINSTVGERSNLWTEDNLRLTGVAEGFQATCPPQADFYARTVLLNSQTETQTTPFTPTVCTGEQVQFVDNSVGGFPNAWSWTFQDGTPATSTARNPVVSFSSPGFKNVTLTVSNDNGSTTKTDAYSILIGGTPNDVTGTYFEGFENSQTIFPWVDVNYANNITSWRRVNTTGLNSNACVMLNSAERNFLDLIDPANGADYDDMFSPTFDLSSLSEATLTFSYAYSTSAGSLDNVTEELQVSISTDCGETWSLLPSGNITGATLINNGNNPQFPPPSWSERSLTINSARRVPNVRFRFRFISSETSGNLFIDNINILGPVGIDDLSPENFMSLYPNPTNDQFTLGVHGMDKFPTAVTITDIRGALVYSNILSPTNQSMQFSATELGLANGLYMINATNEAGNHTQKLMVGK